MLRPVLAALVVALACPVAAEAQPYGYYRSWWGDYGYRYAPPVAYGPDGRYTPYTYYNGYDGFNEVEVPGAALAPGLADDVAYDAYGPDPNGLFLPDGRRIKCKLRTRYDSYWGRSVTRRECW